MARVVAALLCLVWTSVAAAQDTGRALAAAMEDMRQGNWAGAMIEARRDGQEALDVVLWHFLRAGRGEAAQVQDFIDRNPDWPGMPYLREKSETAIGSAAPEEVLAFFGDSDPQTGGGALTLARAQEAMGNRGAAEATVVMAWRTLPLSGDERRQIQTEWGSVVTPHNVARLDMALWRGWQDNAEALLPYVPEGWRELAEARMALRQLSPGVDARIEDVPEELADHAGLAYERFLWRMRKGRYDDAAELILARSETGEGLGEPWAWAPRRADLARDLMRDGRYDEAYRIAARHGLVEGADFAALEWLAGFIALRFRDDAEAAREHFIAFSGAVDSPISAGRAGYWLGRAEEALGNTEAAKTAYAEGARWQTSYYGLLAAERGDLPIDPALTGAEDFPDWRTAAWTRSTVYRAAILLMAAGEDALAERFLTHLAESLDRQQIGQMGDMLAEMGRPHIAVRLGKRAAQFGIEIPGPYYALDTRVTGTDYPVPTELVLSIARRESEFDPGVISHAGARGFMQLMPGTAQLVSGWLDLDYDAGRLLSDPAYNARLGAAYLADLAQRFDGNVVMMAAGYNAGPGRPIDWMERYGDPRRGDIDVIDWVEMIPFDETRNYVMRVAESVVVYRARLGRDPHPVPFSEELTGNTLRTATD
ncbi:lytic transglycosylase domain-containing protein [Allosediminivita pacifica]|uniref:Soluble lytic murein transglycosylase n=1 Tax=Allosediminivita pacifica TaxID=1267769 RepID=A0A2T6B9Y7_9RHOB|nr:lytic transglycosylase domain-containing protein [Allosediminivita pacifica]PTX52895.1 soluble lytic murein transglycosylase [Allosediminivita pacifica]GGA94796.1 lytic transglycosylase [Allosediminivita pacifica]